MDAVDEQQCSACHTRREVDNGPIWYVRGYGDGYAVCAVCINTKGSRLPFPLVAFGIDIRWEEHIARPS